MDITLHWKWLKYDIDQETTKAAKCLITNDPTGELKMEAQTADEIFDQDYCKRKITEACTKLQDILHKFSSDVKIYRAYESSDQISLWSNDEEQTSAEVPLRSEPDVQITLDNSDTLLHKAIKWVISLSNFGTRSNVNTTLLTNELHQYAVLYVLQEWTKLTHPTLEQNYVARMQAEEIKIKSIVYRRENPTRPADA